MRQIGRLDNLARQVVLDYAQDVERRETPPLPQTRLASGLFSHQTIETLACSMHFGSNLLCHERKIKYWPSVCTCFIAACVFSWSKTQCPISATLSVVEVTLTIFDLRILRCLGSGSCATCSASGFFYVTLILRVCFLICTIQVRPD